jgi:hypothetical protein
VRGNKCEGNNGAGIAAIGDLIRKAKRWARFHWIIEQKAERKPLGNLSAASRHGRPAGNHFTDNSRQRDRAGKRERRHRPPRCPTSKPHPKP